MQFYYKLPIAFIVFYFGIISTSFTQSTTPPTNTRSCLTDQVHQEKMANDPVYKKNHIEKQDRFRALMKNQANAERALCNNPVLLPMAIHFQNIASPDVTCLRALAAIQVQILNDDFQGLNADISIWNNTASAFFPGVSNGETCVEFCLGTMNHPPGYGLVDGDPAVTINEFTGDFNADWSGYINVFVRNLGGGLLGYSPLGGDGDGDGVTIDDGAFGSGPGCPGVVPGAPFDLGRTLTHELGHYMNLPHIWGSGCAVDDGVADTPDSQSSYGGCPALGAASCGSTDMHMNYMDYTNDACMYMLSAGQSTVMENYTASNLTLVINNSGVCTAPTPSIQFTTATTTINEGTSNCSTDGVQDITLTLSIAIAPSADAVVTFLKAGSATDGADYTISPASVTFPMGQTADQTITVTVSEDAEVESDEDLVISYSINANGGDAHGGSLNQTHTIYINNDDTAPSTSLPMTLLSQNFDNGLGNWTVIDGGSTTHTWALTSSNGGLDGSQYLDADSDAAGSGTTMNEELQSPVFDGTTVTGLTLNFDQFINIYAGNNDFNETFDVDIWDGSTWQNVFHWGEADGDLGAWGAPNQQSIDISAHAHANNQLRFIYIAEYDWWWSIDNITVTGLGSLSIQMADNSTHGFVEYDFGPLSTIHFYDENNGNIMMTLVNNTNHDYGCTLVEVDRGAGSPPGATPSSAPESEFLTDKTFRVVPEFNNPSGNYTISLYYTDAEITGWETETGSPASDLAIVKADNAIDGATFLLVLPATVTPFGTDHIYTTTVNSGFSGFALGGAPNPLPVELVDLKASPQEHSILVEWRTASETNNKGFELLRRSADQSDFERIAWVDGMGTSSAINSYQQEDKAIIPGVLYYYQLRQVDFDGATSLSKVVTAKTADKNTQVDIHPNPVKSIMHLNINSPVMGTYSIIHASGQLIDQQNFEAEVHQLALDMRSYARGVYWLIIQTEQEKVVKKVVLAKD